LFEAVLQERAVFYEVFFPKLFTKLSCSGFFRPHPLRKLSFVAHHTDAFQGASDDAANSDDSDVFAASAPHHPGTYIYDFFLM
jgi:hypothetical protein